MMVLSLMGKMDIAISLKPGCVSLVFRLFFFLSFFLSSVNTTPDLCSPRDTSAESADRGCHS